MSIRRLLLGDPRGMTAWQRWRERWKKESAAEQREKAFARAYNPLRLKPGNLVEIGPDSYEVQTVFWYATPGDDPDYARYGLVHLEKRDTAVLEAMPESPDDDRLVLSLFEVADELELDEQLLEVLRHEDVLRHTDPGDHVIDWHKDFETEATLTVFSADEVVETEIATFNYFVEDDTGERYLTVEVAPEEGWMSFFRGRRLERDQVLALGTVPSR
jgi:hypothetical protein